MIVYHVVSMPRQGENPGRMNNNNGGCDSFFRMAACEQLFHQINGRHKSQGEVDTNDAL